MADPRQCTSGCDKFGRWHIACQEPAMGPMGILQNMGYANSMSTQNVHYDWAAIHIRESGGKSWTTNVLDMYTTVAQIPHPPHS